MSKINSYKDLLVWQKSMELVKEIYKVTAKFPASEIYGLALQMRRSAVSIPSNIAEGSKRGSRKDYRHFLLNSLGSGAELETQIEISKSLGFGDDYVKINLILGEVMRMLSSLVSKLKSNP